MIALEKSLATFALNAVWQIAAMALVLAACDLLIRRAGEAWRAAFWTAGLLAAAMLPWLPAPRFAAQPLVTTIVLQTGSMPAQTAAPAILWPVMILVALAVWRAARLIWGLVQLHRIRRHGVAAGDGVFVSTSIAAPMTFGVFRPIVVVPESFWQTAPAHVRRSVIEHERAHIARRDYAWNLVLEAATLAVWWHPATEWMKRRMAAIREFACDEAAAARVSGYAGAIVEAARIIVERPSPQYALGFFDSTNLEERMMKLTQPSSRFPRRFAKLSLAGAFLVLMISAAAFATRPLALAAPQEDTIYKIGGDVTPPSLVYKREPAYTEEARDAKIEGTVVLKTVISAAGMVDQVSVAKGIDSGLDANAIEAIRDWKFNPATKDGKPVRVAATIEVNFRLL